MTWLYHFDVATFREINVGWHTGWIAQWLDPIFLVLSYSGLGQVQFALALLFFFWDGTRRLVYPLLATVLVSGIPVAQGLKSIIARDRPSNLAFAQPQEAHLLGSFPSGHSTSSFAVATTLLILLWDTPNRRWGWLAVGWAALVGFSRIYRGVHWPTDVVAGMCAGVFSACLVELVRQKLVASHVRAE